MNLSNSTLNQTAFLFAFIAIGYILAKLKYIPENCSDVFGASEFAKGCKIDSRSASAILKVMEARGVLVRVANKGRAYQYTRN